MQARTTFRWIPAALLSLVTGGGLAAAPATAHAADPQMRVMVDAADVVYRSGDPYYYGDGRYQPLMVEYDSHRRPSYYRHASSTVVVVPGPSRDRDARPSPYGPRYVYGAAPIGQNDASDRNYSRDYGGGYGGGYSRDRPYDRDRGYGRDRDDRRRDHDRRRDGRDDRRGRGPGWD